MNRHAYVATKVKTWDVTNHDTSEVARHVAREEIGHFTRKIGFERPSQMISEVTWPWSDNDTGNMVWRATSVALKVSVL
jgi:hypothetical protein